jgi:hypothetical protein
LASGAETGEAGVAFFAWLESTAASIWIRESPSLWGFPFILYLHTLGLALIAGLSTAVAISVLTAPGHRIAGPLRSLFPLMWIGLAINVASGIGLLLAYPAKAMTNPVFYIKLIAIAGAVAIVQWLERQASGARAARDAVAGASGNRLRSGAWTLIGLWLIATLTGRLLAYTHSILLATLDVAF